jgi:beta-lactamase regulating signal transducer with metallopeptidase domain/5-hydroxyisourate hydrolase-like protein (transthyretin family)
MTPWIEAIALWLADFYLAGTLLLILAGAAFCLIKQPAWRMALAWGTLVSLLVPAVLCVLASRPRIDPRQLIAREERPAVQVEATVRQAPELPVSEIPFAPEQPAPEPPAREQQTDPPHQTDPEPPIDAVTQPAVAVENPSHAGVDSRTIVGDAVLLFLTGAVLMAARLAVGAWQASRLIRKSFAASPALVDELRTIVGGGVRLPRLRLNARLVTPVATGALRPTIVLPQRFVENSPSGELRAVLGHEWAHIRNGDLWLLALDRCLFPLLWAHPVYWWMRRRIRQDQEFLADAAAASLIGPADYAAQLVAWARDLAGVRRIVVSNAVGIWERPSGFALRISTILNRADRITLCCSGRVRVAVVGCLAAASLAAASVSVRPPNVESAPPEAKAAPAETRAEPAKTETLALGADEISGTCVDSQKRPVAGAQVLLYVTNFQKMTQRLIQQTSTDDKGRFTFAHLAPKSRSGDNGVVVARRPGLATFVKVTDPRGKPFEIAMRKSATFRGTVRDRQGKPVAAAQVSFPTERHGITSLVRPLEGVRCARTDVKGDFAVDDLEEFSYAEAGPPPGWRGGWGTMGLPSMNVVCPGYVETRVQYRKVPGSADAVLAQAATIFGQVVFGETGKPAADIVVTLQSLGPQPHLRSIAETGPDGRYRFDTLPEGTFALWVSSAPDDLNAPFVENVEARRGRTTQAPLMRLVKGGEIRGRIVDVAGRPSAGMTVNLQGLLEQEGPARGFFASMTSDGLGKYRFTGLPGGKFNVFLFDVFLDKTAADVTAAALESLSVECTQTTTAPPIHLIRGGVVTGHVIDDTTGKRLLLRKGEELGVRIYGPTRPWSGGACHYAIVKEDGTFEMRLPPGQSSLLLTTLSGGMLFNPTDNDGGDVTVPDGGEVHVEYHVTPMEPPKEADAQTSEAGPAATETPKTAELRPGPDDLGGTCIDKEEKRISGVQVDLYQVGIGDDQRFVERTSTNDAGQFVFRHVSLPRKRGEGHYTLVFRSKGLATELRIVQRRRDCEEITLGKAATLQGVVKNQQGQPVTGALVVPWFDQFCLRKPIPGIRCSITDARGVFVIDDLAEFKFVEPSVPVELRLATHLNPPSLAIRHPDYEGTPIPYRQVPDRMDIELAKGAVITGLVVDGETGRPAAGLTLALQGIDNQNQKARHYWTTARTDQAGRYRLTSLPAGKFNVYLRQNPPGLTAATLDSFEVRQGQTVEAPPIRLIKGGLIKGRLIDDVTGQLATLTSDETASIGAHGPSRPRNGASIQGTDVKKDGTFEIRLPPGTNWIYLSGRGPFGVVGDVRPGFGHVVHEIDVAEGTE